MACLDALGMTGFAVLLFVKRCCYKTDTAIPQKQEDHLV